MGRESFSLSIVLYFRAALVTFLIRILLHTISFHDI